MTPDATAGAKPPHIDNENPIPLLRIEKMLNGLLELGEQGTVLAVDSAICQAIHHRASDVHLEPWHDCLGLRYRLDGSLQRVAEIHKRHQDRLIARIKVLADLIVYQKEVPQDGRIDAHEDRLNRALRISTFPTIYGEKTVIRILDPYRGLLDTQNLGFDEDIVKSLKTLVMRPNGCLLLTGPSSSGKTTTIYALLRDVMAERDPGRNIVTIEDPVEYRLGRVAQTQISPNMNFTFESAFRSLLRQDPDVIMVGEIRDADTARTAVQAGLTGHLIISSIHSGTAAGVFTRLLDMGIEPFLIASSVTGILAQRLIRTNCEFCATPYDPPPRLLEQYLIPKRKWRFSKGIGCKKCRNIGFMGRLAIGELLTVDDAVSEMILTRAHTRKVQEAALASGMVTLIENGVSMVKNGVTTLEELRAVVPPPDDPNDVLWKNSLGRTAKAPLKKLRRITPTQGDGSKSRGNTKAATRAKTAAAPIAKRKSRKMKKTRPR